MIKAIHILCVFVWIGNLLALTRLMGYHVKEDVDTQMRLAKIYKRMHRLVSLPAFFVALFLGLYLWSGLDLSYKPGWFHMKLTATFGLVVCTWLCGSYINTLYLGPDLTNGAKYKILHGMTGLFLLTVLISASVVRDKEGEIRMRIEKLNELPNAMHLESDQTKEDLLA